MDTQQIGLKLAIDEVGLPFTLTNFDDRLIIQKAVSIIQAAGVNLGYDFHWYLRGPYSPALTRDAFDVAAENEITQGGKWQLDETSQTRLKAIKPLFANTDRHRLAKNLEILASLLYLLRLKRATENDVAGFRQVLATYGKDFSESDIKIGLAELKTYGLGGSS